MNQETENFKKTVEHIHLVQQLLLSAQIELSRRALTHDQSKLDSPEWEMFADITQNLENLTYGSPEYKKQLDEMLGKGLEHHYSLQR